MRQGIVRHNPQRRAVGVLGLRQAAHPRQAPGQVRVVPYLVLPLEGRRGHERLWFRLLLLPPGIRIPLQADLRQLSLDPGHVPDYQPAVGPAGGHALAVRAQGVTPHDAAFRREREDARSRLRTP